MFKMLIFSFIVSLVIGLVLGPFVIKKLKQFHARQSEREEGPESHKYKAGTPTMGGILILTALTVACLLFDPMEIRKALALFLTLGHGVIGFLDDSIKAVKHRNLGLTAKQKLAGQFVMALLHPDFLSLRGFQIERRCGTDEFFADHPHRHHVRQHLPPGHRQALTIWTTTFRSEARPFQGPANRP